MHGSFRHTSAPRKELYSEKIEISPLSVLIDPKLLQYILDERNSGLDADAAYIVRKQLEEADLIVISKSDLLPSSELELLIDQTARTFLGHRVSSLSAQTREGLHEWVDSMMSSSTGGEHLAEIDNDIYARGEAVLGWLKATIEITGEGADWNLFSSELLNKLQSSLKSREAKLGIRIFGRI